MHKKMWAIHSWVGLYAGIVIAILSITGVAALFKVEMDHLLNPHLFKVEEKNTQVDVNPVIDSLIAQHSPGALYGVTLPKEKDDSWIATFILESGGLVPIQLEVFIDPYTGKILGQRDFYYTFAFFLRNIHVRLYEGLYGRQIVGLAGLALLISTITGFWIYGGFMKKQFFAVIRTKNLRIKMADYHKLIGVATLLFNLMIAITGAWLGLQAYLEPLIVGDRPGEYEIVNKPLKSEEDKVYPFNYEEVHTQTRKLFPEFIPSFVIPSTDGSRKITVTGTVPRTAFERERFQITLDKKNLNELYRYDIRKASFGDKVFYIQESLHFGDYGGIILKLVYAFFGITSGFLALTGFIVYLKRTESSRKEKPKFIDLKPLLLRWSYGLLGVIALIAVLHLNFGVLIPTLMVIVSLYISLIFLILRAFIMFFKRRFLVNNMRVNN